MNRHTKTDLIQMQSMPLEVKIMMTKQRIREWVREFGTDGVYVSFSGGKDSTVLLHIVREIYPDIEAVFVNTGLEYPEIQHFVKTFDDVTILRPKMRFDEVIKKYGYPMIGKTAASKINYVRTRILNKQPLDTVRCKQVFGTYGSGRDDGKKSKFDLSKYEPLLQVDFCISDRCCQVMKKSPIQTYERKTNKKPILAMMACESQKREEGWKKTGCNAYDINRPMSNPMAFWTEQDVFRYIKKYNIPIASVYGDITYAVDPEQIRLEDFGFDYGSTEKLATTGCDRTGCIFCAFGCHLEKEPSRFQRLKITHPRQYEYCLGGGEYNEDGIWQPSKEGLGMRHVFEELNKIYGDGFIKYE